MLSAMAGGRVFGERTGADAPWLLALHGWGRSHADWAGVTRGLDALAIDLPGFGASPAPSEPWGLRQFAEAVLPIVDNMAKPLVIAGHSFGGSVAVHLACLAETGSIGGLVLTGSPLIRRWPGAPAVPNASFGFRAVRKLNQIGLVSDERMEVLRESQGSADYRAARGVMRDCLVKVVNEDVADKLSGLAMPVDLVWGAQDSDVPVASARAAAELIQNPTVTVLEGVGHHTTLQASEKLREVVLASHASSSRST